MLELARSLREQIDWDFVRDRTDASPFARAFFTLVEELGVVEPPAAAQAVQPTQASRKRITGSSSKVEQVSSLLTVTARTAGAWPRAGAATTA